MLINYIPEPIRKSVGGFKDKIVSLFKKNTPKQTVWVRKKIKQTKNKILENLLYQKRAKKKKNKDRIIRDIRTLSETEEEKKKKERN